MTRFIEDIEVAALLRHGGSNLLEIAHMGLAIIATPPAMPSRRLLPNRLAGLAACDLLCNSLTACYYCMQSQIQIVFSSILKPDLPDLV